MGRTKTIYSDDSDQGSEFKNAEKKGASFIHQLKQGTLRTSGVPTPWSGRQRSNWRPNDYQVRRDASKATASLKLLHFKNY
jgi:hypothetical protein